MTMRTVDARPIIEVIELGDAEVAGLLAKCAASQVLGDMRADIERRAKAMPEICDHGMFEGYEQSLTERRALTAVMTAYERGWSADDADWLRPVYERGVRIA